MPVRTQIPEYSGVFFIPFTCSRWLRLFALTNCYEGIYRWFDHLKGNGHFILGYVIMPNHLHVLIGFRHTGGKPINTIVGNGKRFIAYDIIKRLKQSSNHDVIDDLAAHVKKIDKKKNKLHEVFQPSFDWKICRSRRFIHQKLNYIHKNPCKGVWMLAETPADYVHSSARFYSTGEQGVYPVISYAELEDVDLSAEYGGAGSRGRAESRGGDSALN